MRKINFRAWLSDVKRPVMVYQDSMCIRDFSDLGEAINYWSEGVELMQCIGMKDINGRECYEGDIFKNEKGEVYHIAWESYFARFMLVEIKTNLSNSVFKDVINEGEIIGNIYENPELLEPSDD